jgi:nitric oxide reductase large subunit
MKAANKAMVGIVAAICMMGLIVVLKNVLSLSADVLSRDMIIYVIVYFGFITAVNFTEEVPKAPDAPREAYDNPWVWSAIAVIVTLAIIAVYAFR